MCKKSQIVRWDWIVIMVALMWLPSCSAQSGSSDLQEYSPETQQKVQSDNDAPIKTNVFAEARKQMVSRDLAARDISAQRVLEVMGRVPRHEFVPAAIQNRAYQDSPLPIGENQTISQPYIVALMTQLVDPQPGDKVLDIGTGSGYQAAVLAELVRSVHSIEIVESLAKGARQRLKKMGYENIDVRHGDGYGGWPSEAPFDIIIVAAAPDHIPKALVEQLAKGGKLVIPVGKSYQELLLIEKDSDGKVKEKSVIPVRFVPMTGEAQK